jgi:hypothetical protein
MCFLIGVVVLSAASIIIACIGRTIIIGQIKLSVRAVSKIDRWLLLPCVLYHNIVAMARLTSGLGGHLGRPLGGLLLLLLDRLLHSYLMCVMEAGTYLDIQL